jgi:hypothetical protein
MNDIINTPNAARDAGHQSSRRRQLEVIMIVDFEGAPFGAGDETDERVYFSDAVAAVQDAAERFYQCRTTGARLSCTHLLPK